MGQVSDRPSTQPTPSSASAYNYHTLVGPWLWLSRITWVAAAALMYGLAIAGALPRYRELVAFASPFSADLLASPGISPETYAMLFTGMAVLLLLMMTIPALLIYWGRQHDWVALVTSLGLIAIGAASTDFPDALVSLRPVLAAPADLLRVASEALPWVFLLIFPTGIAEPKPMRWLGILITFYVIARPFTLGTPLHPTAWPGSYFLIFTLFFVAMTFSSQVYRFLRVSTPTQRQQTKVILYGGAVLVVFYLGLLAARLVVPGATDEGSYPWLIWRLIEYSIYSVGLLPLPVSFYISIRRFRLWDIDFIINRSLVYGALTVLLLGIFGGSLLIVRGVAESLTGGGQSALALAVAAMVFGVLFTPSRKALIRFVDRRFYKINVDYDPAKIRSMERPALDQVRGSASLSDYHPQYLDSGGMADVYKGTHPTLRTPVAIKVLSPKLVNDQTFRERFEREAQIVAGLKHPNIVRVLDYGQDGNTPFMIMEYVEGPHLGDLLREQVRFSLPRALPLLTQIASALDYAHTQGLVHRDIKPSNVMVESPYTSSARAVLMDFGIARMVSGPSNMTQTGLVGTFDYMAPEQIRGDKIDHRADIYAFGVMAFQALTGRPPFVNSNIGALLIAHLQQPAPDPCELAPDMPRRVGNAILRTLAKDADQRYSSAGDFVETLRQVAETMQLE